MSELNFGKLCAQYKAVLKESFESNNLELLESQFKANNSVDHDRKAPLDQAFRDVLLELLLGDLDVEKLKTYVAFCIETCRIGLTTPTMPVVLLGDIFDAITITKCENMFEFVENGVNIWKEELFFVSCKNNLLRMCNDLLRRLSRSQNTVFCGRVLLFLAKFFPFSERSGLNIVSEFNLENVTEYGKDTGESLTVAETEGETGDDKKIVIDYNMYCKFWSLQDFFRNPNQCYNKVQWKTFSSHASSVLMAFNSCKLEDLQHSTKSQDSSETLIGGSHYFAKYLTNEKLLELQLSDSNFRRSVLLQFLILFQYLNSSVKLKSDTFELKADQVEWINSMVDMVYNLLKETPPDGPQFAQAVKHILQREERWINWKKDGCPEFKKPVQAEVSEETSGKRNMLKMRPPKRHFGDIMKEAVSNNQYYMSNPELTKLWNFCPNNLEACKAKERDFLPSLDSYFEEAIEQLDPAAMVEDEYKKVNDPNFGWRALRLLARRSPQFFTYSNNPISKLPEYLRLIIKKIFQDKPGRGVVQQETTSETYTQQEEELLKPADEQSPDNEDEKPSSEEASSSSLKKYVSITDDQLDKICNIISVNWRDIACKLGFKPEEVADFEGENSSEQDRARKMLNVWFYDEADGSLEKLFAVLDDLQMEGVCELIKNEITVT